MKNLQKLQEQLQGVEIKFSGVNIQQIMRNNFKQEISKAILADLEQAGFRVFMTTDGVMVELEGNNSEFLVAIDPVIKSLDYDLEGGIQEYQEKEAARIERERKRAEREKERQAKAAARKKAQAKK